MSQLARDERESPLDAIVLRVDAVSDALLRNSASDSRLSSGLSWGATIDDLDFIQMTGLTKPEESRAPSGIDADESRPVDFYERGVADVDASMFADGLRDATRREPDIVTKLLPTATVADLRDIVAELSRERNEEVDPVFEPAAVIQAPAADRVVYPTLGEAENLLLELEAQIASAPPAPLASPRALVEDQAPDYYAAPTEPPVAPGATAEPTPKARGRPVFYAVGPDEPWPPEAHAVPAVASSTDDVDGEDLAPVGRRPGLSARGRRIRRRPIHWGLRLTLLGLLGVLGYQGYPHLEPRLATASALFADASARRNAGDYEAAANLFLAFAERYPEHPSKPEAQFLAALALFEYAQSGDQAPRAPLNQARAFFEQFTKDHPDHPKVARAANLAGMASFALGEYAKAIDVLRDPALKLKDPVSTLPALRTLGKAYIEMGDLAAARAAYRQAAALSGNITRDHDFEAIGDLYQREFDAESDDERRTAMGIAAREQWSNALEVPGISPTFEDKLRMKRDLFSALLDGELPDSAAVTPALEAPEADIAEPETALDFEAFFPAPVLFDTLASEATSAIQADAAMEPE